MHLSYSFQIILEIMGGCNFLIFQFSTEGAVGWSIEQYHQSFLKFSYNLINFLLFAYRCFASWSFGPPCSIFLFGFMWQVSEWIILHKWNVGDLWNMLIEYSYQKLRGETNLGFFAWLLPSLARPPSETELNWPNNTL